MPSRPLRLLLATSLSLGLAVATALPVAASTGAGDRTSVVEKKRKPALKLADSSAGQILVNAKGRTLYAYDPDGTDTTASKCTGGCAQAWPPATAKKATVGKGLDKSLAAVNADGQLSYGDHLLYLFSGDTKKGDTTGQGVGGVWHVVGPDGSIIG